MAGRYELALASDAAAVTAELLLPGVPPGRALAAFTDPELVRSWWTAELTVRLAAGGEYLARFPALGQTMIGVVEEYEPGHLLAITWGWSRQPEAAGRYGVTVSAGSTALGEGPGTRLEVVHAPRAGVVIAPDDPAPGEHLAGWGHFLPRMAASLTIR
jgi:uncharacterized protein YndB with AHSA1/START domain